MDNKICQTIKNLRLNNDISQETLAKALGISTQAISKWENQKALPDIMLLPKIASFFHVSIDTLFSGISVNENILPIGINEFVQMNRQGWNALADKGYEGTCLPAWGVWIPDEEKLHMLNDLSGKKVLEIACGAGYSLLYLNRKNVKELWGIDFSEFQIERAKKLLKENKVTVKLFLSPMELNPGIPEHYFDCVYSIYGVGWTHDLDKTISLVAKYLRTNGTFVFFVGQSHTPLHRYH